MEEIKSVRLKEKKSGREEEEDAERGREKIIKGKEQRKERLPKTKRWSKRKRKREKEEEEEE